MTLDSSYFAWHQMRNVFALLFPSVDILSHFHKEWGVWELAEPSLPACFSGTNQMCVSNLTAQGAYF